MAMVGGGCDGVYQLRVGHAALGISNDCLLGQRHNLRKMSAEEDEDENEDGCGGGSTWDGYSCTNKPVCVLATRYIRCWRREDGVSE